MKREEIGALIRKGRVPWVSRLPEARQCMVVITVGRPHRNCARPAGWAFTADSLSRSKGGVYCWTHLSMITSSGEEQARLEEHLRGASAI